MKTKLFRATLLSLFTLGAAYAPQALAGKSDDTLNIAFPREFDSLDVYSNTAREGIILSRLVWDGLLYRDPVTGEYKGNLATSYDWKDDKTLHLTLREGVKFHNNEEFDADDVVATVNWVADPANGAKPQRNVSWMASAEKLGKYEVLIHLKKVFPAALEFLAGPVVMYPNEYLEKVGVEGMSKAPVGTGPYKYVDSNSKLVALTKNTNYHTGGPKGQPSIGNINIRIISERNTQIAELLSGGVDWAWQIPADQADKLAGRKNIQVQNESTMRIGYLGFDASGRHSKNPMNDLRVRQAVAHAINRPGIVKALVRGRSTVVHSACFPSQFGCETNVKQYEYDPKKAKALLAEAGYPKGFKITFHAYRNRDYGEAMINDLRAVGINVEFVYLKYAALRDKVQNGEVPFSFMTWGSYSINDVSAITSNFFKQSKDDYARDQEVNKYLEIGDGSTDVDVRKNNYSKALKRIADQVYWLPLWSYNSNYVFSKDLDFTPTTDEIPRFFTSKWK